MLKAPTTFLVDSYNYKLQTIVSLPYPEKSTGCDPECYSAVFWNLKLDKRKVLIDLPNTKRSIFIARCVCRVALFKADANKGRNRMIVWPGFNICSFPAKRFSLGTVWVLHGIVWQVHMNNKVLFMWTCHTISWSTQTVFKSSDRLQALRPSSFSSCVELFGRKICSMFRCIYR